MNGSSNQFWEIEPFNFDGVQRAMANAYMQPYNFFFVNSLFVIFIRFFFRRWE